MNVGMKHAEAPIEIIDLSAPLVSQNSPVYPGTPQPLRSTFLAFGDSEFHSNVWTFEEHTGTHVDAPAHILPDGPSIEKTPLSRYVGQGAVLDFSRHPPKSAITRKDVLKCLDEEGLTSKLGLDWILLFRTGHTEKFGTAAWMDNPGLDRGACELIADLQVKGIGFDAASPDKEPYPAHKILLPRGVAIYENLANLEKVLHLRFIFVGVPLNFVGGTASPVRAFALILRTA